jgi:predicted ArsR family transcriptional regulator
MSERSKAHAIRRALGRALLRRRQARTGSLDLAAIADAEGVSVAEVRAQLDVLAKRRLVYARAAMSAPAERATLDRGDRGLSGAGLRWAEAGFPDLDEG